MNQHLRKAIEDATHFVEIGMWAKIDVNFGQVLMYFGNYMPDGRRECWLVCRSYYVGQDGPTYTVVSAS
jgi:hypothetical protein